MPSQQEKIRRKNIRLKMKQEKQQLFLQSLPACCNLFKQFFDYLDDNLQLTNCDHTDSLARSFLEQHCNNTQQVITWLNEHGGFCDCEIVWNVEESFESIKMECVIT